MMDIFNDGPRDHSLPWRDGVYLCTVNTTMQADIIESKLRSENIPCVRNYRGAGNFMEIAMGSSIGSDIEIYVPEEALEDAKNIIVPIDLDDCSMPDEE